MKPNPESTDTPFEITVRASKLSRTVKDNRRESVSIPVGHAPVLHRFILLSVAVRIAGENRNRKGQSDETLDRSPAPRADRER